MYQDDVLSCYWQHLLNEHERVLGKASKNLTSLLVPHIAKLKEALNPLLSSLTWSSIQAHRYFDQSFQAVRNFEVLIDRWVTTNPYCLTFDDCVSLCLFYICICIFIYLMVSSYISPNDMTVLKSLHNTSMHKLFTFSFELPFFYLAFYVLFCMWKWCFRRAKPAFSQASVLNRINGIFHHRMEGVLAAMSAVKLYVLPDTAPWTLELFVHNTWLTCCHAAQVGTSEQLFICINKSFTERLSAASLPHFLYIPHSFFFYPVLGWPASRCKTTYVFSTGASISSSYHWSGGIVLCLSPCLWRSHWR